MTSLNGRGGETEKLAVGLGDNKPPEGDDRPFHASSLIGLACETVIHRAEHSPPSAFICIYTCTVRRLYPTDVPFRSIAHRVYKLARDCIFTLCIVFVCLASSSTIIFSNKLQYGERLCDCEHPLRF